MGRLSRSRRGCLECRDRHRKCDECLPSCIACRQRGQVCRYPPTFQWEIFDSTSFTLSASKDSGTPGRSRQRPQQNHAATRGPSRRSPEAAPATRFVLNRLPPANKHQTNSWTSRGGSDSGDAENVSGDGGENDMIFDVVEDECRNGYILTSIGSSRRIDAGILSTPGDSIAFVFYAKSLANILQANSTSLENPYSRLADWALEHPVLLDAIISCSCQYMFCYGRMPLEVAIKKHQKAISSICSELDNVSEYNANMMLQSKSKMNPREALVAAILLQVAHTAFSKSNALYKHMSGALYLLRIWGYLEAPVASPASKFLVQRFLIVDVATSILHRRKPLLPIDCWIFERDTDLDAAEPRFHDMTGCPYALVAIWVRIAHLGADMTLETEMPQRNRFMGEIYDLESDLRSIQLRLGAGTHSRAFPTDSCVSKSIASIETQSNGPMQPTPDEAAGSRALALCFYWVAQLLIYRRLYGDPTSSIRVQHVTTIILQLLQSLPADSSVNSAISLPFFLTSRELLRPGQREWIRQRHREMRSKYPNPARAEMMALTEDIWEMLDNHEPTTEYKTLETEIERRERLVSSFVF